jgi:hypothetical protein
MLLSSRAACGDRRTDMSRNTGRIAVLFVALFALHATAVQARTRVMMCAGCGTVIDADPIWYSPANAPAGAVEGTIIGAKIDGQKTASVTVDGLIGRDARRGERGNDASGLRLEVRMDNGGRRIVEVGEGLRVYRRDRVRMHDNKLEVID